MKINEFLHESENEKLDELLGTVLGLAGSGLGMAAKGAGAILKGANTGKQVVQQVGRRVAPTKAASTAKATRQLQDIGVNTNSWLNSRWRDLLAWQIQRKGMKAFKAGQAAAYENGKIAANLVSDLGLKIFGAASLAYDISQYYQARQAAEEKYANDPEKLDQALNELNTGLITSVFLPGIIGGVGKMTSKAVGAIIGKVASPRAGAMVKYWGGMIAKGGEVAAMGIFRTEAGKKWLAEALANVSVGAGIADSIMDSLKKLMGMAGDALASLLPLPLRIAATGKWLPNEMDRETPTSEPGTKTEPKPEPNKSAT
jgi:hypothetical protein